MDDDHKLPVILIAYANDHAKGQSYLRNLSQEITNVQNELKKAKQEGLCEVETVENATVDLILSAFQKLRDRVAIFHFAGHANGFQLLLESESGQLKAAYAGGLAAFLGQQRALELVFLNGCSTEQQVQGLLDANCSAVIATAEPIDDQVAMNFATRFYRGLGTGAGLEKAYNEAVADIKSKTDFKPRALYCGNEAIVKALAGRYPWGFHVKPGADMVRHWNLPDAADNPLFSLPRLPKIPPPKNPFRHLKWFDSDHAEVFFGRGFQIRELYEAVTTEGASPIVLFSGQTGVGKSSVLHAGLMPRLEGTHNVHYIRQDPSQGLLETLISVFGTSDSKPSNAWKQAENERNRPVIVVLDQVEEVFIDPNKERPNELEIFMDGLVGIFGSTAEQPRGRLILGFRKEWLLDIKRLLEQRRLPFSEIFIETIDRRGVIEAITGLTSSENLKQFYKLEIEPGLAGEIADDLLADRESPVAPTLQILLTKLWNLTTLENSDHRKFTRDEYLNLKRDGLLLSDFIDQQLRSLEARQPEVVNSGLALDFLYHHTNTKGTATELTTQQLLAKYPHQVVSDLVREWKGKLLSDIRSTSSTPKNGGTRLAHDTLAPLIRERFGKSDAPGQRALRILENRSTDWAENRTGPVLGDADLEIVNKGESGMRAWTKDETRLVEASQAEADRRRAEAERRQRELEEAQRLAEVRRQEAERHARTAVARLLASEAQAIADHLPDRALLLAAEAVRRPQEIDGARLGGPESVLRGLLASIGGLALRGHNGPVCALAFAPQGGQLVTGSEDGTVRLWELAHINTDSVVLRGHESGVGTLSFAPQGRWLATGSLDNTARLWDLSNLNAEPVVLRGHESDVTTLVFDPIGRWLATGSSDNTARLWDLSDLNTEPVVLRGHEDGVLTLAFDPMGRWLATGSSDNTARLWDISNLSAEPVVLRGHEWMVYDLAFDPMGRWLATGTACSNARLWDLSNLNAEPVVLRGHEAGVQSLAFAPQGRWLAVGGSTDGTVCVWDPVKLREKPVVLRGHKGLVQAVAFDPTGRWLATGSMDNTARLWDLSNFNADPVVLRGHVDWVSLLAFDPKGRWLATGSVDRTARLWDLDHLGTEPVVLGRQLRVHDTNGERVGRAKPVVPGGNEWGGSALTFDPKGRWLATGSEDHTARLWNLSDFNAEPVVLRGHEDGVLTLSFAPQGHRFATGSSDNTARLWDLSNLSAEPVVLRGHESDVTTLVFDPIGRWLATGSSDNTARLWDLSDLNTEPVVLRGHERGVGIVAFDPKGRWLATGSIDGTARLWDLAHPGAESIVLGRQLLDQDPKGEWVVIAESPIPGGHEWGVYALAFDPKGRWLATGSVDGTARLWDINNLDANPVVLRGHMSSGVGTLAFDPQGRRLATGSNVNSTVCVWDLAHPSAEPIVLRGQEGWPRAIAFDPQGRWLATGSTDGTVCVYDPANLSAEPVVLRGHKGWVKDIAFDPKGRWLATGSKDGTARLWQLDIRLLLDLACQMAGRNLTLEEWHQHVGELPYQATCPQFPSSESYHERTMGFGQ